MDTQSFFSKPKHPEAESSQTFGIVAVVCLGLTFVCGCPTGIIGIILGLIAVNKAKRVKTDFYASPGMYHIDSLKQAETGRMTGLISSIVGIILTVAWVLLVGFIFIMSYLEKGGF